MIIYLFKGASGEIITMNEMSAHNELRNRSSWQRQDLRYMGACEDTPIKEVKKGLKDTAISQVIDDLPQYKLLLSELELAEMDKDEDTIKRKKLEIEVFKGNFKAKIADRTQFVSSEVDELQAKVIKIENKLFNDAILALVPDPNLVPRNFNGVTSGFGGDFSDTTPSNIILPS